MAIAFITNGNVMKGCVGLGSGFDWNCSTEIKDTTEKQLVVGRERATVGRKTK